MANHSATLKDVRKSKKRNERNRYYGKTTRNAIKSLKEKTDLDAQTKELPSVLSMIDKLAKRGVIHKNKAANLKSKLTKHLLKTSKKVTDVNEEKTAKASVKKATKATTKKTATKKTTAAKKSAK